MSYPWYRFKVVLARTGKRQEVQWTATGLDPQDAMSEVLEAFSFGQGDAAQYKFDGWRIVAIEYLHYDTFGMDPESDKILLEEAKKEAESETGRDQERKDH